MMFVRVDEVGGREQGASRRSEIRGRRSEVGGRRSEIGGRRSGVGSQRSEVGGRDDDRTGPVGQAQVGLETDRPLRQAQGRLLRLTTRGRRSVQAPSAGSGRDLRIFRRRP